MHLIQFVFKPMYYNQQISKIVKFTANQENATLLKRQSKNRKGRDGYVSRPNAVKIS